MKGRNIKILSIFMSLLLSTNLTGCTSKDSKSDDSANNDSVLEEPITDDSSLDNSLTDNSMIDFGNPGIKHLAAETVENDLLVSTLKDKLGLSDDDLGQTRYYYNYVDLNMDGKNEIFVEIVGDYTTENNGDRAFIFEEEDDGSLKELDSFTLIKNPIIISDSLTNGWKNIIVKNTVENSEDDYLVLKYDGNNYSKVDESDVLATIDNETGIALISNNVADDMKNNKGLYLHK